MSEEPFIDKKDYERLMSQGNKEDMQRLFEYAVLEFKETKKREGIIKVKDEYAKITNPEISEKPEEKIMLLKPGDDRLITEFVNDATEIFNGKKILFYRIDSKDIVEIGSVISKKNKLSYLGFIQVKPNRFITCLERFAIPYSEVWDPKARRYEVKKASISPSLAATTLESHILQESLPQIKRIFTVPTPILYEGKLTFPKIGYDERFCSWLSPDAPEITNINMSLDDAKNIIEKIFKEFCFENEQSKTNAIAALLTPFLRGLYSDFNVRTPMFFYLANRERAGKDFCAGISGIVYEGVPLEEQPVSDDDELRKIILAALIAGRKRLHFSNNKGHINSGALESALTATKISGRKLGQNELLMMDNELEFSQSGNVGVTFTPDLANRSKFIKLFLDIEDANSRKFENPDLHGWVRENRGLILSALYTLIRNWIDNGMKSGSIPFTSFPEWSKICGGVMESAGFGNPCIQDLESLTVDSTTSDIKNLFELAFEKYPEQVIDKSQIQNILKENEIFGFLDLDKRADQTKFWTTFRKYVGRIFSDIKLIVDDSNKRPSRQKYQFTKKVVTLGNLGQPLPLKDVLENDKICIRAERYQTLPEVTNLENIEIIKLGATEK